MTAPVREAARRGGPLRLHARAHDAAGATYDVAVETAAGVVRAQVRIGAEGAGAEGEVAGLDAAHAAQMIALAKTIGRRADDAPWPRRVERWRAPGVR